MEKLVEFIYSSLHITCLLFSFSKIFEWKKNKFIFLSIFLYVYLNFSLSFVSFAQNSFLLGVFDMLASYLLLDIIMTYFLFKTSLQTRILACLNYNIIYDTFNFLLIEFFHICLQNHLENFIHFRWLAILLLNSLSVFTFYFYQRLYQIWKKLDFFDETPLLFLGSLFFFLILWCYRSNYLGANIIFMLFLSVILIYLSIYLILYHFSYRLYENKMKDINSIKSEEIQNTLTQYYDIYMQNRKLKHDLYDELGIIATLLKNKEYTRANEYFEKIYNCLETATIKNISNDPYLDIYFNQCIHKYPKISFHFNIFKLDQPNMLNDDLHTLIINLLNNAIEAINKQKIEEAQITLIIKKENSNVLICCCNPTKSNPFTNNFTSNKQARFHGYGHIIITDIINKYHGDMVHTYENNILEIYILLKDYVLRNFKPGNN